MRRHGCFCLALCRLGLHDTDVEAARAYDRVAIRKWGREVAEGKINFPLADYDGDDFLVTEDLMTVVACVRGACCILLHPPLSQRHAPPLLHSHWLQHCFLFHGLGSDAANQQCTA